MAFTILTIAATFAIAAALVYWRAGVRRRKSWESLVQRLEPGWDHRAVRSYNLFQEGRTPHPKRSGSGLRAPRACGPCMRMPASCRIWPTTPGATALRLKPRLLVALRRDALQIRFCVVSTLVQYAFTQMNESICAHAFRATSTYTEMADRARQLLQVNNGAMAASFAGAGV